MFAKNYKKHKEIDFVTTLSCELTFQGRRKSKANIP